MLAHQFKFTSMQKKQQLHVLETPSTPSLWSRATRLVTPEMRSCDAVSYPSTVISMINPIETSTSVYNLYLSEWEIYYTYQPFCYIGKLFLTKWAFVQQQCNGWGKFFKMAADLEIFKCLYLFSLTSYSLITGLADFSFTEQCYWYLQSALNPCLKATPLSVEKPNFPSDFPDFLRLSFFFLSSFFLLPAKLSLSYQSLLSYFLHSSSALGSRMRNDRVKRRHFLLRNFMVVTAFDAI